jgi:hypothetical protein
MEYKVRIRVTKNYKDIVLQRHVAKGEILDVSKERGEYLISLGLGDIIFIEKLEAKRSKKKLKA